MITLKVVRYQNRLFWESVGFLLLEIPELARQGCEQPDLIGLALAMRLGLTFRLNSVYDFIFLCEITEVFF